jgi:hypothetical protein
MVKTQWDIQKEKCGPFQNIAGNPPPPHLYSACVCNEGKYIVQNYVMKTQEVKFVCVYVCAWCVPITLLSRILKIII